MEPLITNLRYRFFNGNKIKMVNPDEDKIRGKEIFLFTRELALYKVKLNRLVNSVPKEATKNLCLNIAYYIIEDIKVYEVFTKRRELPVSKVCRETGVSRTFVELWADFIIAYTLILANPNYRFIQEYLNVTEYDKEGIIALDSGENSYKGIILKRDKKSGLILTSDGSFVKIKISQDSKIGEEIEGEEKKGIRHYKKQIALCLVSIVALFGLFYYKYSKINSIIVINTTSLIKVETNTFNRVIYSYSPTEKGSKLLDEANVENMYVDNALKKILEIAKDKEMLIDNSVTIFINKNPISYDSIEKTEEYLIENNIETSINNAGYEHKVRKGQDTNESEKEKE